MTTTLNAKTAMMKPLPILETKSGLKAIRDSVMMTFLENQEQSVCISDIMENIGEFPGCEENTYESAECEDTRIQRIRHKRNSIKSTVKRLETQGRILSTLFNGRRYYSIPVMDN